MKYTRKNIINSLLARDIQNLDAFETKKNDMTRIRKGAFNHYLSTANDTTITEEITTRPTQDRVIVMKEAGVPQGAARFNLSINRPTANIAEILYVPIFGCLDYEADYVDVINKYLSAGTVLTIARTADKRGLTFTYVKGGQTDIITVQIAEKPYVAMLRGTQGSLIKLSQIKAKIGDAANEEQFTAQIIPFINSLFGRATEDKFTADDWLRDDQYVQTMRTINQDINIDAESGVIFGMYNVAGNLLTMTTVVQKFETSRAVNF